MVGVWCGYVVWVGVCVVCSCRVGLDGGGVVVVGGVCGGLCFVGLMVSGVGWLVVVWVVGD